MKIGLREWILIIALLLAILAISPSFKTGALIKSVEKNSTAFNEGLRSGMIINNINGVEIKSSVDYSKAISDIFVGNTTDIRLTVNTNQGEFIFLSDKVPEISVDNVPKTKIKTGLDLSGGARALIKAENISLDDNQLQDLIAITNERLNTFGLSDVNVRGAKDLQGNNYLLVEIAGATPSDIKELVGSQGKFEAKVGNLTVFESGEKDVSDVCRNDAKCSGITECPQVQGGYACNFKFVLYLTEAAAKRQAAATANLSLDPTGQYLSEKLYLFLDDKEVDSLNIGADLRGNVATEISIQGSGSGTTQQDAYKDAQVNMKRLQTVLITGSLPYKLEVVKLDTISPTLGKEFTKSLLMLGLFVFIAVSVTIFVRYRKIKITLAVILTIFSEAILTLGIAALIRWNLDAPSIAGIIAGLGTGVNDQIVIIDESRSSGLESSGNVKERIKRALFIIVGAFLTIVAAMLPLFWAGAGMLRGFALTTILGVSVGILITRPAFADILRKISQ